MKFDSTRDAARYIARSLNEVVPWVDFDAVTYVPSARKRVRERGYDHTRLIAREFAKLRHVPLKKLISRRGATRQVGKDRKTRRLQAGLAYEFRGDKAPIAKVLLIDDVISTGATIEVCTSLLRKNGVTEVYVACFGVN